MKYLIAAFLFLTILNAKQPPTAEESFLSYQSAIKEGVSFDNLLHFFSKEKKNKMERDMQRKVELQGMDKDILKSFYMTFAGTQVRCHKLTLLEADYVKTGEAVLHYSQALISCGQNSYSGDTQDVYMKKEDGVWKIDNIELSQ